MFATALTVFIGISFIVGIVRVIRAILHGDLRQLFESDPSDYCSIDDEMALENHGVSPGDIGYDR